MAVDLATETILTADQATKLIGPARKEKPPNPVRIIRAIKSGALEGLRFGNQWVTSVEALQRWGERQAAGATSNAQAAPLTDASRTPTQRRKAIETAERDLAKRGVLTTTS